MGELDDFEIDSHRDEDEPVAPTPQDGGSTWPWIVGIAIVAAGALGVVYWQVSQPAPAPVVTPAATPLAATPEPTPSASPAIDLPALDQSDALIRDLARGLSPHAQLGLWLTQSDLMRRFVTVVVNIDEGVSPRAQLGFLAPKGRFAVSPEGGRIVVDPASYARYDAVVDGIGALDAQRCVELYRLLLPLGEAAYAELGKPRGDLTTAVRSALRRLLETPEAPERPALKPVTRGGQLLYQYADPRLEALSPAQKHLLRLGARNARRIQTKLRELSEALGGAAQAQAAQTP
jgi:hypothetical protein